MSTITSIATENNVSVKFKIDDSNNTVCEIVYRDDFGRPIVTATGRARWNPSDVFEEEIGQGIAFGRALSKYGPKLVRHFESLSETPAQRRGRLKVQRRIYESGEILETILRMKNHKHKLNALKVKNETPASDSAESESSISKE